MATPWRPPWANETDAELLRRRICDLGIKPEYTSLPRRVHRLYRELAFRGIAFRPHFWFSDDWFSPDGTPGIAVPFYLAHPRLMKLQDRQMFDVEGGTEPACLRLLRHEAGHAIDTAYRLHRRKLWKKHFGSFGKPYPDYYRPRPGSKGFVHHLDAWYAQSHPAEDFAETFAVWLRPASRWRTVYRDWPALKKLLYVDELMGELRGKTAPVRNRSHYRPVRGLRMTLGDYYEEKRAHYSTGYPTLSDRALLHLFRRDGGRRKAAAFLRRNRARLRNAVAAGTGHHPYTVNQILNEMIGRCRELNLVLDRPEDEIRLRAAVLISVRTMSYAQEVGRNWIAL